MYVTFLWFHGGMSSYRLLIFGNDFHVIQFIFQQIYTSIVQGMFPRKRYFTGGYISDSEKERWRRSRGFYSIAKSQNI